MTPDRTALIAWAKESGVVIGRIEHLEDRVRQAERGDR